MTCVWDDVAKAFSCKNEDFVMNLLPTAALLAKAQAEMAGN